MQTVPQNSRQLFFKRGVKALKKAGIESAVLDAAVLLGHVTGAEPETVLLDRNATLSPPESELYGVLIRRRCRKVAVSRLVGKREFYSRQFVVNGDVLDPRPDTEILVEEAIRCLQGREESPAVLDVGTGSGAIAVTLASELPRAKVIATDISLPALGVARRNALIHSVHDRVIFIQADLLTSIRGEGRFDAIVSNPPYVSREDYDSLPEEVRAGDPARSLIAGDDGKELYPDLARHALVLLAEGGSLVVEVGAGQAAAVAGIFRKSGFRDVTIVNDLSGTGRVVRGTKNNA